MKPKYMINVAIADDSAFHRQIMRLFASSYDNISIIIDVANGSELIQMLSVCKKLPHICILDLHMPIMNGIVTAQFIGNKYPDMHLFGYTSSTDDQEISHYSNFVTKIFSKDRPKDLFHKVHHLFS